MIIAPLTQVILLIKNQKIKYINQSQLVASLNGYPKYGAPSSYGLIKSAKPEFIYTHNLADKHDTHVGVTLRVIEALRSLEAADRPQKVYGCEVWRDLDWVVDQDKVTFDVSTRENLQAALLGVFDSQITGGKRYDLATMGRRRANATYFESHGTDIVSGMIYAIDLTPLILDIDLGIQDFLGGFIERAAADMQARLTRLHVS